MRRFIKKTLLIGGGIAVIFILLGAIINSRKAKTPPPTSIKLSLAKTAYALDEVIDGTVTLTNANSVAIDTVLTIQTFFNNKRAEVIDYPMHLPVGTTEVHLRDMGALRINNDPASVGTGRIQVGHAFGSVSREGVYSVIAPQPVTIIVDAGREVGLSHLGNGFLTVRTLDGNPDWDLITALRPAFWRIAWYTSGQSAALHQKVTKFGAKVTVILSDVYAEKLNLSGDQGIRKFKPWEDWPAYERLVQSVFTEISAGGPVAYWDLWSEPNWLWGGNQEQFLEMVERTTKLIRALDPHARIIGPSIGAFEDSVGGGAPIFPALLDYMVAHRLHPDAVSWHEFKAPDEVAAHVSQMRQWLDERPQLCIPQCPELHINEFAPPVSYLIPGWTVGWLSAFEQADVDWASRACWWVEKSKPAVPERYGNCSQGLDGLFGSDNRTPHPVYWVQRFYADMQNDIRLQSESSSLRTVVIAGKTSADQIIHLLVGRYTCGKDLSWCTGDRTAPVEGNLTPSVPVTIVIKNLPTSVSAVRASINRIPNENVLGSLPLPVTLPPQTIPVHADHTLTLPIASYQDGDGYAITLSPL